MCLYSTNERQSLKQQCMKEKNFGLRSVILHGPKCRSRPNISASIRKCISLMHVSYANLTRIPTKTVEYYTTDKKRRAHDPSGPPDANPRKSNRQINHDSASSTSRPTTCNNKNREVSRSSRAPLVAIARSAWSPPVNGATALFSGLSSSSDLF